MTIAACLLPLLLVVRFEGCGLDYGFNVSAGEEAAAARMLERHIAQHAGMRNEVGLQSNSSVRPGERGARKVLKVTVTVPWRAYSDSSVATIHSALTSVLRVDPQKYQELEIKIETKLGLLAMSARFEYVYAKGRWRSKIGGKPQMTSRGHRPTGVSDHGPAWVGS